MANKTRYCCSSKKEKKKKKQTNYLKMVGVSVAKDALHSQ